MMRAVFVAALLSAFLLSCGQQGSTAQPQAGAVYHRASQGDTAVVTGRVRLVGSAPFHELVLTEEGGYDWYIENGSDRKVIADYQQQTVTVRGTVALREIMLSNGKYVGTRRILTNINLLK